MELNVDVNRIMASEAGLIDLPTEVQIMVLHHALPYDFESLVLTCKQLHAASSPLLSRHNALRRKYHRFHFTDSDGEQNPKDTMTVTELLLDIAADPIVAQYIVHADFGDRVCFGDLVQRKPHDRGLAPQRLEKEETGLRILIQSSQYLALLGLDTGVWFDKIVADLGEYEEEVDYPIAFLLSLLPNLESLALPHEWRPSSTTPPPAGWDPLNDVQQGVQDLVLLLVTRANATENVPGDQPLRKLHTLLPTKNVDSQFGMDIAAIAPFLALDSLRKVHRVLDVCDWPVLHPIAGNESSHEYVLEFQTQGKYLVLGRNLETAVFDYSVMSHDASEPLFKHMQSLKQLEVRYDMKDEIGYDWQPDIFISNLIHSCGENLENLSLVAENLGIDHGRIFYSDSDLKDLHGFKALTHLVLDTKLFIHSRSIISSMSRDPTPEDEIEVPSLVDIAPPALKTFHLYVPSTREDYLVMTGLLGGLNDRRDELPDLEGVKVIVEQRSVWGKELDDKDDHTNNVKRFCEENDIEVAFRY